MKRVRAIIAMVLLLPVLTACGGTPSLIGNWQADDGKGMKVVNSNGFCSNIYDSGGEPLDIGGLMTCSFSVEKGSDGRYALVVSQPPNQ